MPVVSEARGLRDSLGGALLVLLVTCLAQPALARRCPFGISPETARRFFDQVKKVDLPEGYRFEGLSTSKTEMAVLWSLHGRVCPLVPVIIEGCTPLLGLPTFQLAAPPEFSASCPGLDEVVKDLSRRLPAEHLAGFSHAPVAVTLALGVMWVVFAALLFDRDRLWRCRRPSTGAPPGPHRKRTESRAPPASLLALFCFSLLLNWSLSSGGPGDLRLNLAAVWSPELELRWGPAPIALFRLLAFALGGIRDTQIIWSNLILGSLVPILLYGIVSELGVDEPAALLAAFVVAAHPLLIAFSGVLGRQPAYMFAACGSALALIVFLRSGRWGPFIAFLLGAILSTTSRPEGAQVLILYAAVLLATCDWKLVNPASRFTGTGHTDPSESGRAESIAGGPAWPARRRAQIAAVLALALLVPLAFAYAGHVLESKPPGRGSAFTGRIPLLWTILFDRDFTPLAWIVAWTLGLVLGIRRRAAWVALLVLLGLDFLWKWTGVYHMFVGHVRQVASSRYESILLIPFAIGMGLLIQAFLETRTWLKVGLAAVFVAFTAVTWRGPYETLLEPFTVDHEYRFLERYALTLPPHARLYVFDSPIDDIGFLDANLVGQFAGSPVSVGAWSDRNCNDLLGDPLQTYLYIGSSCAELVDSAERPLPSNYADWMRSCAAMRARVSSDPVEMIDVPAHKMSWYDFRDATVRLALYRLKDPSICPLGPSYPWRARDSRAQDQQRRGPAKRPRPRA